jgi:tetrapyrrole methylase family protein / MazG family protein
MTLDARLRALLDLIGTLRGENGCPWDRRQTPASMGRYLAEEVFELMEAIEKNDAAAVAEELGDVLFQVFFIAELYREAGRLELESVLAQIHAKMVRRHPHVFAGAAAETTEAVRAQWTEIKRAEKGGTGPESALEGVPAGLPALLRAWRISQRAIAVGFDWPDEEGVLRQAEDEWREFRTELSRPDVEADGRRRVAMEFGDLLFTLVNVARFARIHPETALTAAIGKFEARFRHMERATAAAGKNFADISRPEMEELWERAKQALSDKDG